MPLARSFSGHGGRLHFKRAGDIHSLRGYSKSGESGGVEIIFRGTYIEWNGLRLPLKLDQQNPYEAEMLAKRVKYVRILRTPENPSITGTLSWLLEGKPTVKETQRPENLFIHPAVARSALTIGPRTIAYVSENEVGLRELAVKWRTSSATSDGFSESWIEVDGRQIPITMRRMVR